MGRIKSVRRKLSQEFGFLVPAVHIRDNLDLGPNTYRLTLMGVPMGEAEVHNDRLLAINPGQVHGNLQGIATQDPAFGLEAVWIESGQRELAQSYGYTVVDPATVSATDLSQVLQNLLAERVPIRNMRSIVESLAEHAGQSQDPGVLSAAVRVALGRQIVQEITGLGTEVPVITLAPELDQILLGSLAGGGGVAGAATAGEGA